MESYWLPQPWLTPVILAEGTDERFYAWDGNHRLGVAFAAECQCVPAIVGFRMRPLGNRNIRLRR